jgi:hypothetical protein
MSKKHIKEELLKQLEDRTSSHGLLRYSQEYYRAYELIQKQHPRLTEYFAVKYYLLCHSLELTMKAWLRKRGAKYFELKRLGHNLENIMQVLYKKHHLLFDAKSQAMISLVNQQYSQKEFEYSLRGVKNVPEITELAYVVRLLISRAHLDIVLGGDPRKLRSLGENKT